MSENLVNALKAIARSEPLSDEVLEASFEEILTGEASPERIGAFLMGARRSRRDIN